MTSEPNTRELHRMASHQLREARTIALSAFDLALRHDWEPVPSLLWDANDHFSRFASMAAMFAPMIDTEAARLHWREALQGTNARQCPEADAIDRIGAYETELERLIAYVGSSSY